MDTCTQGERHIQMKAEVRAMLPQAQELQRFPATITSQRKAQNTLPHSLRRSQPCQHLGFRLWPPELWENNFAAEAPRVWCMALTALGNEPTFELKTLGFVNRALYSWMEECGHPLEPEAASHEFHNQLYVYTLMNINRHCLWLNAKCILFPAPTSGYVWFASGF